MSCKERISMGIYIPPYNIQAMYFYEDKYTDRESTVNLEDKGDLILGVGKAIG